ncbi:MAG: biopolymer transporter ExbD [Myxococcales bacterium]|nr:biopolymer transporter ExbD [Myxococcales bacterium]
MSEEKASMALVKRLIRRRIKRHPEHEHQGLNIYPMLDMMTILLVFMVMQFASSTAAAISQSAELTIPYSTSTIDLGEATPIQISRSAISVDGVEVCALRNGLVDPSQKQGGGTGFLITPLKTSMDRVATMRRQIAAANPGRPFVGEVQIIADHRTPFRTLSEVIYTLGQSGFAQLRFVANKTQELGATAR